VGTNEFIASQARKETLLVGVSTLDIRKTGIFGEARMQTWPCFTSRAVLKFLNG